MSHEIAHSDSVYLIRTLCSENAEEMASGEEARFWADLNQKYIT